MLNESSPILGPARLSRFARPARDPVSRHWSLDPDVTFLNHGSFGATPRDVLEFQRSLRAEMEREPVRFMVESLEPRLDAARAALAEFLGADSGGLAFVPNATAGVNAVVSSLRLEPGDELLTTDHAYNACRNVLDVAAARAGAKLVIAEVAFPVASADEIVAGVLERVGPRTRFALIDHITSPTGVVLPIARLVRALEECGVLTVVDGAHAPGCVDLCIRDIAPAAYTGNCHKWMCAPKGAGFLWVRADVREWIRPSVISHGHNARRTDRSRFHLEFDWTGTADPTAYLCVPEAIRVMGAMHPEGWEGIRRGNRAKGIAARQVLARSLGVETPVPDEMVCAIASLELPPASGPPAEPGPGYESMLQRRLVREWGIQVPIITWRTHPARLVRISAQLYNSAEEYDYLARALEAELARERERGG